MRRAGGVLAALALLAACGCAGGERPRGATVEGRVVLQGDPPPAFRMFVQDEAARDLLGRTFVEAYGVVVDPSTGGVADVLVWLTDRRGQAPPGSQPARPAAAGDPPIEMALDSEPAFVPAAFVGPAGGRLRVANQAAGGAILEAQVYDPHSRTWQPWRREFVARGRDLFLPLPYRRGLVRVRPEPCPWISGRVLVTPSPFATVTRPDGSFRFEGVPLGSWILHMYHPEYGVSQFELSVAENRVERRLVLNADERAR